MIKTIFLLVCVFCWVTSMIFKLKVSIAEKKIEKYLKKNNIPHKSRKKYIESLDFDKSKDRSFNIYRNFGSPKKEREYLLHEREILEENIDENLNILINKYLKYHSIEIKSLIIFILLVFGSFFIN